VHALVLRRVRALFFIHPLHFAQCRGSGLTDPTFYLMMTRVGKQPFKKKPARWGFWGFSVFFSKVTSRFFWKTFNIFTESDEIAN
jgi:hypothetical protein